jgi:hypothetical protein
VDFDRIVWRGRGRVKPCRLSSCQGWYSLRVRIGDCRGSEERIFKVGDLEKETDRSLDAVIVFLVRLVGVFGG